MEPDFRLDVHRMIAESIKSHFDEESLMNVADAYSYHLGVGHGIIDEQGAVILEKGMVDEIRKEIHLR